MISFSQAPEVNCSTIQNVWSNTKTLRFICSTAQFSTGSISWIESDARSWRERHRRGVGKVTVRRKAPAVWIGGAKHAERGHIASHCLRLVESAARNQRHVVHHSDKLVRQRREFGGDLILKVECQRVGGNLTNMYILSQTSKQHFAKQAANKPLK